VLEVRGLSKRFGDKVAIESIDLTVERGDALAVVGPNGAGKSTTFLCLAGLLRPDRGTIAWDGRLLGPERGQTIALIPETPDVYPMLTVWEHLAFVAGLTRRPPGWEAEAGELLERLGMSAERDTLGHALSKGMRQKTLIAATVLGEAPVLLLDEPMIGLDPLGQRELRGIIADLRAAGHALLLSSHQLETAASLADRMLILDQGRVAASETVDALRARGASLDDVFLDITGR
jgi:ABC-type multidrug transport system ATPase subunit